MKELRKNNVLLINAGPHKNGASAKMLNVAKEALLKRNDEVKELNLYDVDLKFCKGCLSCWKTKKCVMLGDDYNQVYDAIMWADEIVIATPTYWGNVPAKLKNMFDRMYGASLEETKMFPRPLLSGKKYSLLISCNTPQPFAVLAGQASGCARACKEYFKYSGMKKKGIAIMGKTLVNKVVSKRLANKIKRIV